VCVGACFVIPTTPALAFKICMLPTQCICVFIVRHNLGVGWEWLVARVGDRSGDTGL
jgi:hypothetical protein